MLHSEQQNNVYSVEDELELFDANAQAVTVSYTYAGSKTTRLRAHALDIVCPVRVVKGRVQPPDDWITYDGLD